MRAIIEILQPCATMSSESADIGVLRSTGGAGINDAAANDEQPTTRMDVYAALDAAAYRGSCCAADKADGSTTAPTLPAVPGLHIKGIGNIPLPISDGHAEAIKSNLANWKVNNAQYHNVYQVEPENVTIQNPKWDASLKSLVENVAFKLGANPEYLSAELSNLLFMEKGSHFGLCVNNDKVGGNVLGTLLVQLPSSFTGGKISIISGDEEDHKSTTLSTFELGAGSPARGLMGEAEYACHFVCYYSDCDYSFEKIKVSLFKWGILFFVIFFLKRTNRAV